MRVENLTYLTLISYSNPCTYTRKEKRSVRQSLGKGNNSKDSRDNRTKEVAESVATGIVDEGGVLVVLLGGSHYLGLCRKWESSWYGRGLAGTHALTCFSARARYRPYQSHLSALYYSLSLSRVWFWKKEDNGSGTYGMA